MTRISVVRHEFTAGRYPTLRRAAIGLARPSDRASELPGGEYPMDHCVFASFIELGG